jgi:acetyl esterase/lipase
MNRVIGALVLLFAVCGVEAQNPWRPSTGHIQVPIWPGRIPDARPAAGRENAKSTGVNELVAGKPYLWVEDVSIPTMTVYSPTGKNSGATVIVFPGGGYEGLAIDIEGTEVCDWLVSHAVTCVLLKYRVPAPRSAPYWGAYPQSSMALEDAQRTISLVRARSSDLKIDSHKIGVLGFSAGGHLAVATSVHFGKRLYPDVDAADQQSCRPDFAIALYPGHLSTQAGTLNLVSDIATRITSQVPPTFLLQNENDSVDSIWDALSYYAALVKAKVPVEFHTYAEGGHAFGLRKTKYPATSWPQLVEVWLHTIRMIPN